MKVRSLQLHPSFPLSGPTIRCVQSVPDSSGSKRSLGCFLTKRTSIGVGRLTQANDRTENLGKREWMCGKKKNLPYFLLKNTKLPYFLKKLQKYPTFRYTQFAVARHPKILGTTQLPLARYLKYFGAIIPRYSK